MAAHKQDRDVCRFCFREEYYGEQQVFNRQCWKPAGIPGWSPGRGADRARVFCGIFFTGNRGAECRDDTDSGNDHKRTLQRVRRRVRGLYDDRRGGCVYRDGDRDIDREREIFTDELCHEPENGSGHAVFPQASYGL